MAWATTSPEELLDQVSGGSRLDHLFDVLGIAMRGKDENFRRRDGFENLTGGLKAVQERHRDIHDNDIGAKSLGQLHRFPSGLGFGDNFDIAIGLDEEPQPLAHDGVVLDQENGDALHTHRALAGLLSVKLRCRTPR